MACLHQQMHYLTDIILVSLTEHFILKLPRCIYNNQYTKTRPDWLLSVFDQAEHAFSANSLDISLSKCPKTKSNIM